MDAQELAALSGDSCEDVARGDAACHQRCNASQCRLLRRYRGPCALGALRAANRVRPDLADQDARTQVDDEFDEVRGVWELVGMCGGDIEPVVGEDARHPDRNRIGHAKRACHSDQDDDEDRAEQGDDRIRVESSEGSTGEPEGGSSGGECERRLGGQAGPWARPNVVTGPG